MSQPDFWARAVALVNEWQRRTGGIMAGREMEELRCALADAYFEGQESARASPSPETRTAAAPETRTGEGAGAWPTCKAHGVCWPCAECEKDAPAPAIHLPHNPAPTASGPTKDGGQP